MTDVSRREKIEQVLAQIDQLLRTATPGPAQRELRVRHASLARVVGVWGQVPPHDAQASAMLECLLDLRAAVVRASSHSPRDPANPASARTTRPPPRRAAAVAAAARTTRPPPRRRSTTGPPSSVPPSSVPPSRRD